jgi:hypothetical protein
MPVAGEIYAGSAPEDAQAYGGWVLGHFMPPGDIRHSADVEIKWAVHPQGDQRAQWVTGEVRTAVIVLVSGRFRIDFREQTVVLARQGDYVVFHGVDHSWFAEQDSVIVAIRWPSVAGYAVPQELRLEARTAGR